MKNYFIRLIISHAFRHLTGVKLSEIHQTSRGWVFVITDQVNNDDYLVNIVPIRSQVTVAPSSVDELLKMNIN